MSTFGIATIVFALVGAAVYFGIVYFAGRKGWWWLAILLSLPAAMGGAVRLFVEVPPNASMFARYFGWLVLVQLTVGVIAYRAGRGRSATATRSNRNTQA